MRLKHEWSTSWTWRRLYRNATFFSAVTTLNHKWYPADGTFVVHRIINWQAGGITTTSYRGRPGSVAPPSSAWVLQERPSVWMLANDQLPGSRNGREWDGERGGWRPTGEVIWTWLGEPLRFLPCMWGCWGPRQGKAKSGLIPTCLVLVLGLSSKPTPPPPPRLQIRHRDV